MPEDESRAEPPERRPDLWLRPGAGSPGREPVGTPPAEPSSGRQPPGWRPGPTSAQAPLPPYGAPPRPAVRGAAPAWPATRRARSARMRRPLLRLGVAAGVLVMLTAVVHAVGALPGSRGGTSSSRPTAGGPPPGTVPSAWTLDATQARPDLTGASFLASLDGTFQQSYVADVGGVWLTASGDQEGGGTVLHALDPTDGHELWRRELDGVLCGTESPGDSVYCASVLERDEATGLGTRWRLHAIDLLTGKDRTTTDVDGWLSAVHWEARSKTLVVVEQRQPAPHAVLRDFSSALRERWSVDLSTQPGQAEMFTEDRIIMRKGPDQDGLVLDRPRVRDVGDGLVALWAGQRTAFVSASSGKLVMVPHCSRLVDDGTRLWCNEEDGATAYSYDGTEGVRVRGPRLAFPGDDGVGVDRNRPVFVDDDGVGVSVDVKTGKVGEPYTPPGRGSAFGQATMPSTETVDGSTFLVGQAGTMLLDAKQDRVVWRNPDVKVGDTPIVLGDRFLIGAGRLTMVDAKTGAAQSEVRIDGLYAVGLGDRVAGVGPERISLARF